MHPALFYWKNIMAISFNSGSVFNLKPISLEDIRVEVQGLLIRGEECVMAFRTVRDQLIFTNKRIISIDVQGLTGKRKQFTSMPYNKIQYFSIQTPGFLELIPDSELMLVFTNGANVHFEFKGATDIGLISRVISEYVL